MSGAEKPPELVEDPRHPQSSVQEDRSREERVHGSQEVGAAYNDADDTDDDLEICFGEEMDAMGSTSDNGSDDGDEFLDGGIEKRSPRMGELEKLEMTCVSNGLSEDANATLEWSQFMNSTEVMLQYMEDAIAKIEGLSSLAIPPPSLEGKTQHNAEGQADDQEQGYSSPGALFSPNGNKTQLEPTTLPAEVLTRLSCANTTLAVATEPSTDAPVVGQPGPWASELLAPNDSAPGDSSVPGRPSSMECRESAAKQTDINKSDCTVGLAEIPSQYALATEASPPSSESPGRSRAGLEPNPDKQVSAEPSDTVSAASLLTSTPSSGSSTKGASVQNPPISFVGEGERNTLKTNGSEPKLPVSSRVIDVSGTSTSRALLDQMKSEFACFEGGIPVIADAFSQVDVMASIGESEVARRIKREKARCLEARQQRRKDSVARARHEESFVAFQAAWRGRRARAKAAPALSARRRESEERRQMFEEERLAEGVVALETERREMEAKLLMKELKDMRCEETRIRQAWLFLRRLEETARGEELVRMRAEERFTRALLDLELQDLRRLESARRETGETYRMRSEDHAMQDLMRLEEAQMAEREAMGVEDALAGIWKKNEECELAFSRAEESRMAVEDRSSSVWNAEYRRLQEARYRKAWARSTPIQRAMDPEGMAAVHSLVCSSPTVSSRRVSLVAGTGTGTELKLSLPFDGKIPLMLERARRRESCKSHLERIASCALRVRSGQQAASKRLDKSLRGYGRNHDACGASQGGVPLREGQASPREERGSPVERDGEECELTVDMLSHLGPLQDLTALELCVEGLTSAPLLKACTSLKSLSLNVNRLSSPSGLVVSTSLVRLGLRDNRLSSLEGLSGLPCLRELRLDINHVTSLHELKQLPALIELSANTNHIRELPEEFAADLMSPQDPVPYRTNPPCVLVEKAVACGGLQKLELYYNRIASVHPRAFQGLASLTHLDLGRNQLRKLDGQALESCPALSTLVLSQNLLQEPPHPLCLPLLSELWLSGNQIRSMGAWASCPKQAEARPCLKCFQPGATPKAATPGVSEDSTGGGLGTLPGQQSARCNELSEKDSDGRGRVAKSGQANESEWQNSALLTGGEGGNDTGEVGVWLPSLEVLHLQDNALESLGGCSAFVGCPLLRSFDASFNQLRTPDDIGSSLQACSELEEVRLHDNPASSSQQYADAVALSCPKLVRMDGVQLDTRVHWRAGANTYGARADLVLPFLLNTDESSDIHGTNEQTGNSGNGSKASSVVEIDETCPWCGTGRPSTEKKMASANDSTGGATILGTGDEGGGLGPISHGGVLSRPAGCTVGNDRSSHQRVCASCGFLFPDKVLWSAPDSLTDHFPFSWEDVCSEGDRWRREVCLGAGFHDAVETNHHKEEGIASAFRTACLRDRDERASTRRRHRREERDLAARADLNEGEPRAMNLGGDSMSRLATMAPSRRRLEVELELGKQQAEERRDQAARQLCFHGGGVDVGGANKTHGVVHETPKAIDLGDTDRSRIHQSTGHRRSRAARVIQHLWHRRQERAARSMPGREDGTTRPVKEQAVMKLQSAFRGFHVRRALQAALESARYVDDEVEGLLNVNGGTAFELDRFVSPPPELADGWWDDSNTTTAVHRPTKNVPRHPNPPDVARASGSRLVGTARPVVSSTPTLSNARNGDTVQATREADLDSPRHIRGGETDVGVNGTCPPKSPRTPTVTVQDAREAEESFGSEDSSAIATDNAREESGGGVGSARADEKGLAQAWGLKDPSVARAMMRRAKRLRKFQNGEARREKMKNPDVRFEAFAKTAGEHRTARGASLSESVGSSRSDHGGRVKSHRYGGGGGARGYAPRPQAASPRLAPIADAWAKGQTSDGAIATTRNEGRSWSPLKPPHCSRPGGNLVVHTTRGGGRPRAAVLSSHDLDEEVLLQSGSWSTGGERRAGIC